MNTITHPVASEEIMAFLDGEFSADRAQSLSAHIGQCADCFTLATDLRGLSRQMTSWRVEGVPERLTVRVTAAIAEKYAEAGPVLGNILKLHRSSALKFSFGAASAVVALLLLIAIATPNLLRSRIAANESSAVGSLRTLNTAAVTYLDTYGHYPPSLRSFGPPTTGKAAEEAANLVDADLAAGRKSGYLFSYRLYPAFDGSLAGAYNIQADPLTPGSSGYRHFSTDQTGMLFADGVQLGDSMFVKREKAAEVDVTGRPSGGPRAKAGTLGKLQVEKDIQEYKGLVLDGPMIARTVSLSIAVKDFDAGRASLDSILARHNGYAAGLDAATPQGAARTLQASLRIPAPQLAAAVSELKALGRVEAETQNGEEVTQQHADLLARLKNSRETEQRLQDVLRTRTGKVKDVLEVEQEIAGVRGQIEQMEAEQQTLEHRVNFATIDLKLAEEYKAELTTPAPSVAMQLRNAIVDGFRTAFQSFLALVLFLAESAPTLLLWLMILAFPSWLLWRRYQRSRVMGSVSGV